MNLKAIVEKIQSAMESIPRLNCGGCGVFTLATIKELKKRNIPYRVRVANNLFYADCSRLDKLKNIEEKNLQNIFDANRQEIWFGHVFPEVKIDGEWQAFDSDLFAKTDEFLARKMLVPYSDPLPDNILETLANNPQGWNILFDRSYIPQVFDGVQKAFA